MEEGASASSSSHAASATVKAPPKKRAARAKKEAALPSGAESIHSATAPLSQLLNSTQLLLQPAPLPPPSGVTELDSAGAVVMGSVNGVEGEEGKKGRKALLPSKRQAPPPVLLPSSFPSSSPSSSTVRVTPGSKQFLTPMSSARLLAFKALEEGEGRADGIIRRLEYDEKTQPTPGRAEANQRQKQGLPLLVYCRIRPLSTAEQCHTTSTTLHTRALYPVEPLNCSPLLCYCALCCCVVRCGSARRAGRQGV